MMASEIEAYFHEERSFLLGDNRREYFLDGHGDEDGRF